MMIDGRRKREMYLIHKDRMSNWLHLRSKSMRIEKKNGNESNVCICVCIMHAFVPVYAMYACAAKIEDGKKVRRFNNHNFSMFFNVYVVCLWMLHFSFVFHFTIDIAHLRIPQHCSQCKCIFFCYSKFEQKLYFMISVVVHLVITCFFFSLSLLRTHIFLFVFFSSSVCWATIFENHWSIRDLVLKGQTNRD